MTAIVLFKIGNGGDRETHVYGTRKGIIAYLKESARREGVTLPYDPNRAVKRCAAERPSIRLCYSRFIEVNPPTILAKMGSLEIEFASLGYYLLRNDVERLKTQEPSAGYNIIFPSDALEVHIPQEEGRLLRDHPFDWETLKAQHDADDETLERRLTEERSPVIRIRELGRRRVVRDYVRGLTVPLPQGNVTAEVIGRLLNQYMRRN